MKLSKLIDYNLGGEVKHFKMKGNLNNLLSKRGSRTEQPLSKPLPQTREMNSN